MRYAHAIAEWAEAGGYDQEVVWDVVAVSALGVPFAQAQYRELATLSGGEQKRIVLEALFRGPDEVLLLDEPDNYLDVPGKLWLEEQACGDAEDRAAHQSRPRAPGQRGRRHRDDRAGRRRQHRVDPSGRLHELPRGPGRPFRPARRAHPALGRGARQAQGAGAVLQGEGGLQRRPGLAAAGRAHPAGQVRGGRPARGAAGQAGREDAPARRSHRQAGRGVRGTVPIHSAGEQLVEALRPRGLVRRPRRGAGGERLGQVALPAPARRRRVGARPRARAGV